MADLVRELNADTFAEAVGSAAPTLVDFWAVWCAPCRMMAPVVEKLAEEYGGKLNVCKLNVDGVPDLAQKYNVSSIPTMMIFKNGEAVASKIGACAPAELKAWVDANI